MGWVLKHLPKHVPKYYLEYFSSFFPSKFVPNVFSSQVNRKSGFRISRDPSLHEQQKGKCGGYFQGPSWRLSCPDTAWCIQGVCILNFYNFEQRPLQSAIIFKTNIIQFSDKIMKKISYRSLKSLLKYRCKCSGPSERIV